MRCGSTAAVLIQNLVLKKVSSCGCRGRGVDEVNARRLARRAAEQALSEHHPGYKVKTLTIEAR
ncbi:MAG TPA: hypothetical protein VMU94_10410 [Streptosporangiaceae bacterium]|nr:hypothetical protein [Streptosporangiaceae bacterium]